MADFVVRTEIADHELKVRARRADGEIREFVIPLGKLRLAKMISQEVGTIVDFLTERGGARV